MQKFLYKYRFALYALVFTNFVKSVLIFSGFDFTEQLEIFILVGLSVLGLPLAFAFDKWAHKNGTLSKQ